MLNGRLWMGKTFQTGELGHMVLIPGGRRCSCEKQGCADAYLSPQALELDGWEPYAEACLCIGGCRVRCGAVWR